MTKLIWSELAMNDIKSIHDYIAKDSADRAALFIERLIEAADRLEDLPYSGRIIAEIGKEECREIIYEFTLKRLLTCISNCNYLY